MIYVFTYVRAKQAGSSSVQCPAVRDALKYDGERPEKLTGKAAKPPVAGGGGDKKLTADEWLAEELKKGK